MVAAETAYAEPVETIEPPDESSDTYAASRRQPPLLEPSPSGPAARFADAVGPGHPVRVFLAAAIGGYVLLVAFMVLLGLLLTRVILHIHAVSAWDASASRWLAGTRTPTLVDLSWVGSTLAGGVVIPILVGGLLLLSRAAPPVAARCVHAVRDLHRVGRVSRDVSRDPSRPARRPPARDAARERELPVGATAASVALFGGLLLVLASRVESLALRMMLWSLVIVIPAFVIWARLLRGMHHVTDTAAGVILGILALCITVFAARAAGAAAARRDGLEAEGAQR